ncbi:MAG: hypothetical protein GY749_41440 [Desulfobacteraceae bacterium]|nr:hypothetical protein [Desulfobacteraceae bacterium]
MEKTLTNENSGFENVKPPKSSVCILSAACILPPLFLFLLITRYWVNIPSVDQWFLSAIFGKYCSGTLSFSDLFAQHNECRLFFPKLIFLFAGLITGWDVRVEMCITLTLVCFVSFNLFNLLRRISEISMIEKLRLLSIINILMFSTVQYENWLWGIQLVVYIPVFLLTAGLLINMSGMSVRLKLTCSAILSAIATFSFANGMVLWILLLPFNLLLETSHEKKTGSLFYIVLYFILFFSVAGLYFKDYSRPIHHPPLTAALSDPAAAVRYFLIWTGTPFAPFKLSGRLPFYIATGGFIIFLSVSITAYNVRMKSDARRLACFYPWFVIGIYSLISGITTTLGRVGFGVGQASSSRYAASSIFLPISLLVSVYLTYVFHFRNRRDTVSKIFKIAQAAVLFIILLLHTFTYVYYIQLMEKDQWFLKNGKLALQFSKLVYDETRLKILWHDPKDLLIKFSDLIQHGLLDFKPVNPDTLKWVKKHDQNSGKFYGFMKCTLLSDGKLHISGWAYQPEKIIPADNVIIAYTEKGRDPQPVAVTMVWEKRPGVEELFKTPSMLNCGFSEAVDISGLPAGELMISAWTVDVTANVAYKLNNNFRLSITGN